MDRGELQALLFFAKKGGVIIMEKNSMEKSSDRIQGILALYENEPLQEIIRNLESVGLDPVKILKDAIWEAQNAESDKEQRPCVNG